MQDDSHLVNAKLIDGRVYVQQPDGSFVETAGKFDAATFDATTEDDIARMAEEDGEEAFFDPDMGPTRLVHPLVHAD